jgi:peptide/nickel transport system permease protein
MLRETLRRLLRNPLAVAGAAVVLFFCVLALCPWRVSSHDPNRIDILKILEPPSAAHPLGTDDLGRDVLARMLHGARISLSVGFVAESIAIGIGLVVGLLAGYYGGKVDSLLMRFVDIMLCFPTFFLILAVIASSSAPPSGNIMFIIGVTGWMGVARLVRAETLSLKERDFVAAARAQGAGTARILFRHILPNTLAPVLVAATLGVAGAILVESGLSFLGIGVQPPTPSWGINPHRRQGQHRVRLVALPLPGAGDLHDGPRVQSLGEGIRTPWTRG